VRVKLRDKTADAENFFDQIVTLCLWFLGTHFVDYRTVSIIIEVYDKSVSRVAAFLL